MSAHLFASERGAGQPTVVFLHGFGGGHFVWSGIQADLARDHHTLAYDLPGHGGSLAFPEAGAPKVAARAVLADLAERGIRRAHFVGHSMGGAVAALIAIIAPDRVGGLTLVAPGGLGSGIAASLLQRYAAARGRDELAACLAQMGARADGETLDAYVEMNARPGQAEKLTEIAGLLFRGDRQGEIPRESLAGIAVPVTVLWGTDDAVLPFEQSRDLPWRFGLHVFAGAGHMLVDERPAEIAELIRDGLR